jgi:hypothetical protein
MADVLLFFDEVNVSGREFSWVDAGILTLRHQLNSGSGLDLSFVAQFMVQSGISDLEPMK